MVVANAGANPLKLICRNTHANAASTDEDAALDFTRLNCPRDQQCEIRIVVGMAGFVRADIDNVVPLPAQVFGYQLLHVIAGVIRSNYNFHDDYLAYKNKNGRERRAASISRLDFP
jgi:hypothetical protein